MGGRLRFRSIFVIFIFVLLSMSCALPFSQAQPTATATPTDTPQPNSPVQPQSAGSSGGSQGGGLSGSSAGGGASQGSNPSNPPSSATEPSPSETPATPFANIGGPYAVKQIETLGHESISGTVCSVTKPFAVNAVAPEVAWVMYFIPKDANNGSIAYSYTIPKAGESHDAKGTYNISLVDKAGTLLVSLTVSDHVVFKGFDGNIPNRYKFDLVPTEATGCP